MKDKNYSIDQLEDMLAPRQEFHVSRDFTARVMEAAKAGMEAPVRRQSRLHWAWTAAAAATVAAVIMVGLFLPSSNNTPTDGPAPIIAAVAPAEGDGSNEPVTSGELPESAAGEAGATLPKPESPMTAQAAVAHHSAVAEEIVEEATEPAAMKEPAAPVGPSGKESMTLYAMNSIRVSHNMMVDGSESEIITEADLPITNPDNYELTPEEEQLALHYQREEFLESMRADLKIARMIVENCINENE